LLGLPLQGKETFNNKVVFACNLQSCYVSLLAIFRVVISQRNNENKLTNISNSWTRPYLLRPNSALEEFGNFFDAESCYTKSNEFCITTSMLKSVSTSSSFSMCSPSIAAGSSRKRGVFIFSSIART
jgi:hypothetical protein